MQNDTYYCPLCRGAAEVYDTPSFGQRAICRACWFIFTIQSVPTDDPVDLYSRAYGGQETRMSMDDFYVRMFQRRDVDASNVDVKQILGTDARKAIDFITSAYPNGTTILDIGCGAGYFVQALR